MFAVSAGIPRKPRTVGGIVALHRDAQDRKRNRWQKLITNEMVEAQRMKAVLNPKKEKASLYSTVQKACPPQKEKPKCDCLTISSVNANQTWTPNYRLEFVLRVHKFSLKRSEILYVEGDDMSTNEKDSLRLPFLIIICVGEEIEGKNVTKINFLFARCKVEHQIPVGRDVHVLIRVIHGRCVILVNQNIVWRGTFGDKIYFNAIAHMCGSQGSETVCAVRALRKMNLKGFESRVRVEEHIFEFGGLCGAGAGDFRE